MPYALRFERPDHADFVEADTNLCSTLLVDSQVIQCLPHIEIGLARSNNAETRIGRVDDNTIELVGTAIGKRSIEFEMQQALFLYQRRIGPANVEAIRRQLKINRNLHCDPFGADVH